MLQIEIKPREYFDDKTMEFISTEGCTLELEHSLVSLSKWEEKYKKPFLTPKWEQEHRTIEEAIYYIKCMTLNDVDDLVYKSLTSEDIKKIYGYLNDTRTATTFKKEDAGGGSSNKSLTAEYIYYLMFSNQIPIECERWNLNKLLVLLRVFGAENKPPKKMSKGDIARQNHSLNAARKARAKRG